MKHIILLSDGTGNSSAKLFKTNVWRVYQALDLADPKDPKEPRQFVQYDDGVGNSSFKPLAILGGALGVGLARNVRDLYAFLCRNYEDGDKIFAFGFSRGAFTIRVLNGLILSQGLIKYNGDEAELQRLSAAAYRAFRRERFPQQFGLAAPLRWLRDGVIAAWNKNSRPDTVRPGVEHQGASRRIPRSVGHRRRVWIAHRRVDARHRPLGLAADDARL